MNAPFTSEQKQYLEGFFAALNQRGGNPLAGRSGGDSKHDSQKPDVSEDSIHGTPLDDLCKEERIKHERNGLDIWDTIVADSEANRFPASDDVFRYKFHGLFHVAPAQDAFMLRCRIPGCVLKSHQFAGLAEIAEDWGGGYADITTRGNIQIREIQPRDTVATLIKLDELGLTSKGAGADNIRNITATPTTGFDPQELLDVMPYAKAMHHAILNHRDLYGLPRKFNIAFDSGGRVSVCADTNDIGFYATRVEDGSDVAPGIYFRLQLCGITGHRQFASDSGLLVPPEKAVAVAAAMIRVFIENGDRTNRKKARLKYLVDKWGVEKFLDETAKKLPFELLRFPVEKCQPRPPVEQHGHLGIHSQREEGFNYVGVAIPVGRMAPDQMRGLADVARQFGRGEIRLTVWQNLLIPHIRDRHLDEVTKAISAIGFSHTADSVSGGLVACTGNTGCKFAATNTKGQAVELSRYLEREVSLDCPVNIHLTGCPHSCAQHYIGDIGLLGAKVKVGDEMVEGYTVVLGGGVDDKQAIAREIFKAVPFEDVKPLLRDVLKTYLAHREKQETFSRFTRRHPVEELRTLFSVTA